MQLFSRRNRSTVRKVGILIICLAALLTAAALGTYFYLQRYLVYGRDRVYLDWNRDPVSEESSSAVSPSYDFSSAPLIEEAPAAPGTEILSSVLNGFYVPLSLLQDTTSLFEICESLESPCTLLFDAKDSVGNFYYSSSISDQAESSRDLLSAVIPQLKKRGFYLIARVSAFRDRSFGLNNVNCGLPISSGALWMDKGGCYWLDPLDEAVQIRLIRICSELLKLGFDEICFSNFTFPDSEYIVYNAPSGTDAVIAEAASALTSSLIGITNPGFQIAEGQSLFSPGNGRIYMETQNAVIALDAMDEAKVLLNDTTIQLVFLTDSRDTRFSDCGLLRTMEAP